MKMSLSAPEKTDVRFTPARAPLPGPDNSRWMERAHERPSSSRAISSATLPLPVLTGRMRVLIDGYIHRLESQAEKRTSKERTTKFADFEREVRVTAVIARAIRDLSLCLEPHEGQDTFDADDLLMHNEPDEDETLSFEHGIQRGVIPTQDEDCDEDEGPIPLDPALLRNAIAREIDLLKQRRSQK